MYEPLHLRLQAQEGIVIDLIDQIGVLEVRMKELSNASRWQCIRRGIKVHVRFFVSSSFLIVTFRPGTCWPG